MDPLQLQDIGTVHLQTIDRLAQSASLLAGICKFKKNKQKQNEQAQPEEQEEQERDRIQLINQTIQLSQHSLNNSLKLEPKFIQTIQPIFEAGGDQIQLTPLEDLTLHQEQLDGQNHPQFDHHLIYSQLQIKQNSLNQWIKIILNYNPEENSESDSEEHPPELGDSSITLDDSDDLGDDDLEDDSEFDIFTEDLESSSEESQDQPNLSYTTTLNQGESSDSSRSTGSSSSPEKVLKKKKSISKAKNTSSLNQDGFFNLAEFESEVDQGESQMKKRLRRFKSQPNKSGGQNSDDDDDNDDESEDLDLFTPYHTGSVDDENDDNDGQEDPSMFNLDSVADVRYNDFFAPIKARDQKTMNNKSEKQEKHTTKKDPTKRPKKDDESRKEKNKETSAHSTKEGHVKFSEQVVVQEIPAKNRGLRVSELFGDADDDESDESETDEDKYLSSLDQLDSDEDDDEDMEEEDPTQGEIKAMSEFDEDDDEDIEEEDSAEREQKTMSRLDSELFDDGFSSNEEGDGTDSETDEESGENISKHAKKMKTLSKEIARLEAENVAKKDWMLKGEASSKDRPQNSLLEQDLEFEHVQKIAPAITEEKTLNLEGLIKQRILEANYDDVVRKRLIDPKAFLPSRLLELSDAQPTQSLTEIYEESYQNNRKEAETGVKPRDIRDEKLEKEHQEIKEMFESLSNKLDGLSNAHFTPPEPKIKIKTLNDLPTVSIESTLPTATGTGTLLAPEEIFKVKNSTDLTKDKDLLTHSQKQNLRTQKKKNKTKNNISTQNNINKSTTTKDNKNMTTKDQKQVSLDHLNKISSTLNNNLTSNTSITLLNKRGLKVNDPSNSKHRKLVDGSAFKL